MNAKFPIVLNALINFYLFIKPNELKHFTKQNSRYKRPLNASSNRAEVTSTSPRKIMVVKKIYKSYKFDLRAPKGRRGNTKNTVDVGSRETKSAVTEKEQNKNRCRANN